MREEVETTRLTLERVRDIGMAALLSSNVARENAVSVAESIVAAEADGIHSHGLMRLPAYCMHARGGKVDGCARPALEHVAAAILRVDAANGFAHPAIDLGLPSLIQVARDQGVGILAVRRSYNAGVLGYHVERLAERGLIGLAFANAPAAIAPHGGATPLFGTNPVAFSAPGSRGPALIIDQACSVAARGEVLLRARRGELIPESWALDVDGHPTCDPVEGLRGSMAPFGGAKGVNIAWIVEIMAAALTGACLSHQASSVIDNEGGPPGIGQLFMAIDPGRLNGAFAGSLDALRCAVLAQPGSRVPGQGRVAFRDKARREGIRISASLHREIMALGAQGIPASPA